MGKWEKRIRLFKEGFIDGLLNIWEPDDGLPYPTKEGTYYPIEDELVITVNTSEKKVLKKRK
jgi:hypothetical protein